MEVYHVLACQNDGRNHRSGGSCFGRTALTTSFMRQVAKGDIQEACAESREGRETSPGRTLEMRVRGIQ